MATMDRDALKGAIQNGVTDELRQIIESVDEYNENPDIESIRRAYQKASNVRQLLGSEITAYKKERGIK